MLCACNIFCTKRWLRKGGHPPKVLSALLLRHHPHDNCMFMSLEHKAGAMVRSLVALEKLMFLSFCIFFTYRQSITNYFLIDVIFNRNNPVTTSNNIRFTVYAHANL